MFKAKLNLLVRKAACLSTSIIESALTLLFFFDPCLCSVGNIKTCYLIGPLLLLIKKKVVRRTFFTSLIYISHFKYKILKVLEKKWFIQYPRIIIDNIIIDSTVSILTLLLPNSTLKGFNWFPIFLPNPCLTWQNCPNTSNKSRL
jgi:hypothetical protein